MPPPTRDKIEQMAFMAMMDGIIHTSVPCSCPTCKSDHKSRSGVRAQPSKRSPDNHDGAKPSIRLDATTSPNCNHSFSDMKSAQSNKKVAPVTPSQNKSSAASNAANNPVRSDKVNALLKADSVQAVLEVFNMTSTSNDEKDLAAKIQNATKDCKLYQETKDKIVELCDDENVELDAVFGLLAKFRYERNMLTTAVIKGNSEREKALLCIQHVDHLMYMLQDVAKKKDSKGTDVMHKLGDIIMEIHDLAKAPSTLYDEFLDIKEEHFDLLNDHEEMHQKFVDVNSCHEKLHSSHDKLQSEHTKLQRDHTDLKKKLNAVGTLKNDITRLERSVDKSTSENAELRREVERLNAELAKVNALKHENAQLKKKVTTLSAQPPVIEEPHMTAQSQASKKKKGKKAPNEAATPKPVPPEPTPEPENKPTDAEKAYEEQIKKLKKAHEGVTRELDTVRTSLAQLNGLVRKAEHAKDQAMEKLEVEKATSQNWKHIAKGHSNDRDRLQTEIDRQIARATRLQSSIGELEQTLRNTQTELAERTEAHKLVKDELEQRTQTPAVGIASQQASALNSDTLRLLRKIKLETSQLVRDLDDSKSFDGDIFALFDIFQLTVRRVVFEVERDIEEILSVRGSDPPIGHVPEAVLPFTYNNIPSHHPPQFPNRPDYSPQESPQVPHSSLPPYRPMVPPGFSEPPGIFHRGMESPSVPFSRIVEPPGFSRAVEPPPALRYNSNTTPSSVHSPLHNPPSLPPPPPDPGVIGSRSTSSKLNKTPSPGTTPAPHAGVGGGGPSGLGNGAVGLDWNMWARSGRL